MENKLSQITPHQPNKDSTNLQMKYELFPIFNNKYLSNNDYIKLFYNSKNSGLNINFPLNVVYNKKKSKNAK